MLFLCTICLAKHFCCCAKSLHSQIAIHCQFSILRSIRVCFSCVFSFVLGPWALTGTREQWFCANFEAAPPQTGSVALAVVAANYTFLVVFLACPGPTIRCIKGTRAGSKEFIKVLGPLRRRPSNSFIRTKQLRRSSNGYRILYGEVVC